MFCGLPTFALCKSKVVLLLINIHFQNKNKKQWRVATFSHLPGRWHVTCIYIYIYIYILSLLKCLSSLNVIINDRYYSLCIQIPPQKYFVILMASFWYLGLRKFTIFEWLFFLSYLNHFLKLSMLFDHH